MNRLFRYALIAFGECILIAILFLLFPEEKTSLMILDILVLSIVYLVNVFGYPALIRQTADDDAAGYGLAWSGTWFYSLAVLVAVILFYWLDLSLVWQVVLQCALLFLFLCGMYWAGMAVRHAGRLDGKYKTDAHSIGQIKAKARMLQAVLHEGMEENTRQEVMAVIERTGYLIPNRSTLALTLENQINTLLDTLSDAVVTRQPDAKINSLAEQCKTVLKQRMALPN